MAQLPFTERLLHDDWTFKNTDDSIWHSAQVPGCVHLDLMRHKFIEDPYYRLNEKNIQWIDKANWEYQSAFEVSEQEYNRDHLELRFEGLDTYASVYLNNQLILKSENMHRTYLVSVKKYLIKGQNNLHIVFNSPIKEGLSRYDALDYTIPVSANDQAETGEVPEGKRISVHTRKAGYHYGWDWGPRLVTSGIWRPIKLIAWDDFKIQNIKIGQELKDNSAMLFANIEIYAEKKKLNVNLQIEVDGKVKYMGKTKLKQGNQTLRIPFEIEDPELWWPNGSGAQKLYLIKASITNETASHSIHLKHGIRTIELVTHSSTSEPNFYFKVNGTAIFSKGVNYIPQDVFLPRVTSKDYERLLKASKEANMNMIRVWGGGIYEDDRFYELCDSLGLMVWQDFMFACAMYPGDSSFLENVRLEAIDNVKRLRQHACLALWCGNNENLSAWKRWGWEKTAIEDQSKEIAQKIWSHYDTLFHRILPEVIQTEHPEIDYWSSSPSAGEGIAEDYTNGDTHYWGVWWGKEPFENYNTKISSYMSEYGFQSFPEYSSFQKFAEDSDRDMFSEVMKAHQRSSIGNATIEEYMKRSHREPIGFEELLYMSQLLQADGIQTAIEAHRRNKARCSGSLYWQLNDCWPGASWSSIDYYGKWKALHYKVKEAFAPVIVSHEFIDGGINISVVSDRLSSFKGQIKVILSEFKDIEKIIDWEAPVELMANESKAILHLSKNELPNSTDQKYTYLQVLLFENDGMVSKKNIFFSAPKDLILPNPEISFEIVDQSPAEISIKVHSKNFAKGVHVTSKSPYNFSDNFFDLPINGFKVISLPLDQDTNAEELIQSIEIRSLWSSRR